MGRQPKTLRVGRILRGAAAKGRLLAALLAYPDVKTEWKTPKALSALPVIPLSFVKGDKILNYFSMVTTVGTPQAIAAQRDLNPNVRSKRSRSREADLITRTGRGTGTPDAP